MIYRTGVFRQLELVKALSKDDVMVLALGFVTGVTAYVAPVGRRADHSINQLAKTRHAKLRSPPR